MGKQELIKYFDKSAKERDSWKKRNVYYHKAITNLIKFIVPEGSSVVEVGCGTGDLLASTNPSLGVGIDISKEMVAIAEKKYPKLHFKIEDAENLNENRKFEYIILSDLIGYTSDIEKTFSNVNNLATDRSRVIVTYYNYLWEPILRLLEFLGLKQKQPLQNWLSSKDIENMLYLAGFEVIKNGNRIIFPMYIPIISSLLNRYIGNLPLFRSLGIIQYCIARKIPTQKKDYSVSIVIPCRNEKGNIENAMKRVPEFGLKTEIIFIEKGSNDGTWEEIERVTKLYKDKRDISIYKGVIDSKRDKVRMAFEKAKNDILMILDADLTMPPEDLPKFYNAIASGKGEFINGTRLVYPMEKQAMRFFNIIGNKFFSMMFSWLLGQRIKDTLCGTKVLFKKDYELIAKNRSYFGDFDPFGDFDLLFGAAKLNLKIVEMPVRYRERVYGSTNIQRWKHGLILLRMTLFAMRKIKFIA